MVPVWSHMVTYGIVCFLGTVGSSRILYGPTWFRMVLYGPVWSRMVPYGPVWSSMDLSGPVGSCRILYGPIWSHMIPFGPVWSHMILYSHVWPFMALNSHLLLYIYTTLNGPLDTVCFVRVTFGALWSLLYLYVPIQDLENQSYSFKI